MDAELRKEPSKDRSRLCLLLLVVVSLVLTGVLFWPLPLHPVRWQTLSAFGGGQVWPFRQMYLRLLGEVPMMAPTIDAGYPFWRDLRLMGWPLAILSAPLQAWLGPLGAYNAVVLLTPCLVALATWAFLRRLTQAASGLCAASSLLVAFSPFLLISLANGQIEKAQLWAFPLYLLFLYNSIVGRRRLLSLGLLVLVTLAMTFTCPYFGLLLPLVSVPLGLGWASRAPGRVRSLGVACLALALTAAAMLPAYAYFRDAGPNSLFMPARAPREANPQFLQARASTSPVAQPADTFLGTGPREVLSRRPSHTTYLVLPVLILAAGLLARRFPGRATGLTLFLTGLCLAFGPCLVIDHVYQRFHGIPCYLPARLLELFNYPLAQGAQYYRAISLASLGLAMLVCGGLASLRWRRVTLAAWMLTCVALLDTVRATGPGWPRAVAPVPGFEVWQTLAQEPGEGAVLSLPILGGAPLGSQHLLEAALAERPTSSGSTGVGPLEARHQVPWLAGWLEVAGRDQPALARGYLRSLGFRYVILSPWPAEERAPDPFAVTPSMRREMRARGILVPQFSAPWPADDAAIRLAEADLRRLLGAPEAKDGLKVWDLGPVALAARTMPPLGPPGPPGLPGSPRPPRPPVERREAQLPPPPGRGPGQPQASGPQLPRPLGVDTLSMLLPPATGGRN